MKKVLLGAGVVFSSLLLAACSGGKTTSSSNPATGDEKIKVVATFYPMYDFAKEVVGDEGEVSLLIPAGTEPHDYEPSAKDMAAISDADVLVYNLDEFETWMDNVKDNLNKDKTLVIEAGDEIDLLAASGDGHDHEEEEDHDHEAEESHDHEDEHDHDGKDPHVWTDPVMAIKEVQEIAKELGEKYPEKKATFDQNAAAYVAKLEKLDADYQAAFKDAKNKTLLVQHAAFGYLAHQYGLTQESIAGISPDQEPTPARLAELKHFVEDHGVSVIYFEENANSKVAETLSNETGVKLSVLNPLESLTNEQMKAGENYLSVMEDNLKALKESIK
ncbi:metal ABC transporter solute-binding protein, Zn/Mn family [Enterococcus sp. AD013-P3]|uniref:metal ABC transporter substrate-binding protein n=1 Tax=Enterococcus sp. AD013-P3 TaxID=3411036 RepID=UPI003B929462